MQSVLRKVMVASVFPEMNVGAKKLVGGEVREVVSFVSTGHTRDPRPASLAGPCWAV